MNLKKILAIALILVTLCITLTAISATDFEIVDIGKITKGTVEVRHGASDSDVTFKFIVEVDISDLSDSDKEDLEKAIKDDNLAFIVNATSDFGKVTFSDYQGLDDAYIQGNRLFIENSQTVPYVADTSDFYQMDAIAMNTTDGVSFTAEY